jgi:aarF domain-containing kinase
MHRAARFAALLALALASSRAATLASKVVGVGSTTPPSSRQVAIRRLHALKRAAVTSPADLTPSPPPAVVEDDDADIAYPGPLTAPERLLRAATFWSRALPVVFSYLSLQASFNIRERVLGQCLEEEACEVLWDEAHTAGASTLKDAIELLAGFYVKTGQIIAARVDLFPRQYTDALSGLTDYHDPMPASLVRRVIEQELLTDSERFDDVFAWFDDAPLGAASIAQVHHARLTPRYGGMEVAVKVQRPAIEPKLLGDIANLKALAKGVRNVPSIPVDYFVVFSELEKQLADEFDFVKEATAMERIHAALSRTPSGEPCTPPVRTPLPIPNLVTRRCMVMEYFDGVPLSRAKAEMEARGIDPDRPEAQLFARKLLRALTDAFGRSILETGFFHADPHAGNLFVCADGSIGLIDFGQVKQISGRQREALARVIVALADRKSDTDPAEIAHIGQLSLDLGVKLRPDAKPEGPAATAIWLFDGSVTELPGGYDMGELSPNSPVKELLSFPQDLVLVGRATVLIKVRDGKGEGWAGVRVRARARAQEGTARATRRSRGSARSADAGKTRHLRRGSRSRALCLTREMTTPRLLSSPSPRSPVRLPPLAPTCPRSAAAGHRRAAGRAMVPGQRVGADRAAGSRAEGDRSPANSHALSGRAPHRA